MVVAEAKVVGSAQVADVGVVVAWPGNSAAVGSWVVVVLVALHARRVSQT